MNTINNIENIIIINKSKFITNLFYVENIYDINKYLDIIKSKYKDATHHCYAYIINNDKKFDDDNEPNGTAGKPILDVLEKNNLNYVLCIITRYFGGIKLGASNLLRAYSNSVSQAIKNTKRLKIIDGYNIKITFEYKDEKYINSVLEDYYIINKEYKESILYEVDIDKETLDKLKNYDVEIIKRIIIKK
jgi:uncharacterized YigZ family protein